MSKALFYAEKKDNVLKMDRLGLFNSYIENLPGGRYEIEVRKESMDITLSQYEYYFACIVQPLAEELGYTKVEMDGVLCKQLLTENPGLPNEYVKSKTRLNRTELAKFIDNAAMLAAQQGVVVEPPNKRWRDIK